MYAFKFILAFVLACLYANCLLAKEKITWAIHDMPPAWIISGEYKGKGIVDFQRKAYQNELQEFLHDEVLVTQERLYALMKNKQTTQTYCNAGQLIPETLKPYIYSSNPVDKIIPNHIITTTDNYKKMKLQDNMVQLDQLLNNEKLTLGFVKSRPFGGTVNETVEAKISKTNIQVFPYTMLHKLPTLLDLGRIDYFFDYPFMVKYYKKINQVNAEFVSVKMKENNIYYNYFVICNKSDAGKSIIEKVNLVLASNRNKSVFNDGWKLWLPLYLKGKFKK